MDFRNYDNALGRFNVIDPLAEMDYSRTPYHFTNNNPVLFSDPSGLKGIQTNYGIDGFGRNQFDGMGMYITPDARGASRTPNMFNIMDGGDGYGGGGTVSGKRVESSNFLGSWISHKVGQTEGSTYFDAEYNQTGVTSLCSITTNVSL